MSLESKRRIFFKVLLIVSLIVNVIFIFNYAMNSPRNRIGVLKDNTEVVFRVGEGKGRRVSIILPKGLVVRDTSPRSLDYGPDACSLAPYRYSITLASGERDIDMVDYSINQNNVKITPIYPIFKVNHDKLNN